MDFQALRFQDEGSDKFWAIRSNGDTYAVFYGKTGTQGRCDIKELDSEEDCRKQVQKQINAKQKKGYREDGDFFNRERLYLDHPDYGPHPLTSHPRFTEQFTEEFYYDCGDEEAPFGSDEGADTLYELEQYIKKNRDVDIVEFPRQLVAQSWDLPFYPPDQVDEESVRTLLETPVETLSMEQYVLICDQVIVATALGQIKVMGRCALRPLEMAKRSLLRMQVLDKLSQRGDSYTLPQMLEDLSSFRNPPAPQPSEDCWTLINYLGCSCATFCDLLDDDDLIYSYEQALSAGKEQGYVPLLVVVEDALVEAVTMAVHMEDETEFNLDLLATCRQDILRSAAQLDGKALLQERLKEFREDNIQPDTSGPVTGGESLRRFFSFWDTSSGRSKEVILAQIPAQHPWELAAWMPMGGFNDCPAPEEQAAIMKYWYEQHGAVPSLVTYDIWELQVENPVPDQETALSLAQEHFAFCPDRVEQHRDGFTLGNLADTLMKSTLWYFWWD